MSAICVVCKKKPVPKGRKSMCSQRCQIRSASRFAFGSRAWKSRAKR